MKSLKMGKRAGAFALAAFVLCSGSAFAAYSSIVPGPQKVRWSDVRFSQDRELPFGVDVLLDREMNVVSQRIEWRKKVWEPPYV